MESYVPSRTCPCLRCKANELLAPALLVTFGALFLVDNLHWSSFGRTWPLILIVLGGIRTMQTTASTRGHAVDAAIDPPPAAADAEPGRE
jgi:hypothetical protein